jgi:meiotically up-regulated gene 157 (Mug157) protein
VQSLARSLVTALRDLLREKGVPAARVELAARAVDLLLGRATSRRDDGIFVATGDIPAMWLRDSAAQVRPLLALADVEPAATELVTGVLRLQVEQVLHDPRANAFNPGPTGARVRRDFRDQSPWVFERKYALDSLCAPLGLAWLLWRATGSAAHVDPRFREAATAIVGLWRREQRHHRGSYRFRRRLARRRDSLSHAGFGAPVGHTGLSWSGFRPSDDACVYGYHVPANALAAVSLERLAELLDGADPGDDARALAAEIRAGIAEHGIVDGVYAYEVDGLGNALMCDDANVPSLLSLPYLGFCAADDPLYRATRSRVLSRVNPYWADGRVVHGPGSPHAHRGWAWPLGIAVEGLTAVDDGEREDALRRLEATLTGDLLFHESVDPDRPERYTRRWFSWADMLYVELVLASAGVSPSSACDTGASRAARTPRAG